jgi:ABC-type transport system substrate-binding protein
MPVVNDPEQLWHSRWVGPHTSNHASFADETVDALIEAIQVELDENERRLLFHQLHERLYESQPYMYGVSVPHKFAASVRIRNLQLFAVEPGYSLRRWYLTE